MPIKDRKPFKRLKPPKDLKPNEELFYLKATHEIFRNYDAFFERVIMCNSLVWSCALSGKSNLTFSEALSSEEAARQSLKTFPLALKKPILYLANFTNRKRLNDLCDDVFLYIKDRFFIGEEVEVLINAVKKSSEITQVILPESKVKTPVKNDTSKSKKQKDIAPSKIKYEVVNYATGKTSVVKADAISRPKGTFTKPRNKLFLKQHTQPKDGSWKVKESTLEKEEIDDFPFNEVFCGPLPTYVLENKKAMAKTPTKRTIESSAGKRTVQGKLNFKKESADEKKKNLEKQVSSEKQRLAAEKERLKKEMLRKQKLEEEKEKQRQNKITERLKKREEKRKMVEYLNNWKKPRDDLECDDLKELPATMPVECGIPPNCFGDAMMILEFLNTFGKQVQVKDNFSQGVSFEHIEKALMDKDIDGPLNDLLQLFLIAIFRFQDVDDDITDVKDTKIEDLDNLDINQAMNLAAVVSTWPQRYHGTALRNIPLDAFSLTEILRLHILSSGAKRRVNWQNVVTPSEDPALYFKLEEAALIKKLAKITVFELNAEERCKIINLLINQLLSSDGLRMTVDENADKTRPLRHQLKQIRWTQLRLERGDVPNKKKLKEKTDGTNDAGTAEIPICLDDEEKENTANLTPEEKAQLEEQKVKDIAKQKADLLRKERELEAQIRKLQPAFNLVPLGRDRAFRRYWMFQAVAGVFVEDDDPFKGNCLAKPNAPSANSQLRAEAAAAITIKKYLQNIDVKGGSSDKENEILREIAIVQSDLPFPLKNRKLSDLNPRVDSKKSSVDSLLDNEACLLCDNKKGEKQDSGGWFCPHFKTTLSMDQCTANMDTCHVHNIHAPRTIWSFYYREEDVDSLISNLNTRGFREKALRESLLSEKDRIKEMIAKFQYNTFNKSLPLPPLPEVRKSQRHQNSGNSIYAGLSPRQVQESTLREMILEFEHRIFHGGLGSLKVESRDEWRANLEQNYIDLEAEKIKMETESDSKSEVKTMSSIPIEQVVKELSYALLQVSQGIEAKYLNPPLGESDEVKKNKKSAATSEDSESQQKKKTSLSNKNGIPLLDRWQESLAECTSPSQLFVHLGTLEKSVAWSRSVLKAHCRVCRRRGDGENMLLCDGCNRGHHLYCLKPPLTVIPEGDWFCVSCKPLIKPESPQKKAQTADSESEEASEDESEGSDMDNGDEEEEEVSAVQESCEACGDVGTLLCCDRCPLMYHQECVNLKRIPRGEWLCPKCTKKDEALKKAQRHPTSGSHGTRSSTLTIENKKKPNPLRNKLGSKGSKRKYEESFEDEFEPPSKRAHRDSAQNAARRRSKTVNGADDMLDYKSCIDLLVELMRHPSSEPFLVPVSKKDAPDYHQIIKRPMDFGTIRSKLNFMNYANNEDFVRDIFLVLQNCEWFNPQSSPEYKAGQVLFREVKRLLKEYQICNPFIINSLLQNNENESS